MSALEQEQKEKRPALFEVKPDYDEWWLGQVYAALPKLQPGSWREGYRDAKVVWPYRGEELVARLEHLAELRAHS